MTKEEYFANLQDRPDRYPAAVPGCENPPMEWIAEAWDLTEGWASLMTTRRDGVPRFKVAPRSILPSLVGLGQKDDADVE